MDSLFTILDVASEFCDRLIDFQNFLIRNYDYFKGQIIPVHVGGSDFLFDVDAIYNDFIKSKKST